MSHTHAVRFIFGLDSCVATWIRYGSLKQTSFSIPHEHLGDTWLLPQCGIEMAPQPLDMEIFYYISHVGGGGRLLYGSGWESILLRIVHTPLVVILPAGRVWVYKQTAEGHGWRWKRLVSRRRHQLQRTPLPGGANFENLLVLTPLITNESASCYTTEM